MPVLLGQSPAAFKRYVEPFAGSACLFFALRPPRALLADINSELILAYRGIRTHPRLVSRHCRLHSTDHEAYYRIRAGNPSDLGEVDRTARFLYLNRFCFNGVYRVNRKGRFNVPLGSDTGGLPPEAQLYRASVALRAAHLSTQDFEVTLDRTGSGDFVYLDPPYAPRRRSTYGEYGYGSFTPDDLPRLFAALNRATRRGALIMLSYADSHLVREHLHSWRRRRVTVRRHVSGFATHRTNVREILATNY